MRKFSILALGVALALSFSACSSQHSVLPDVATHAVPAGGNSLQIVPGSGMHPDDACAGGSDTICIRGGGGGGVANPGPGGGGGGGEAGGYGGGVLCPQLVKGGRMHSMCSAGGGTPGVGNGCVGQENFLADLVEAFMERYFPDVFSGAATVEDTFVSLSKLAKSFDDHGAELGIASEEAFAQAANDMLLDAIAGKPGLQIAQVGEQIYIFNSRTGAIATYNNLGQTITMFKAPTSNYFYTQIIQNGGIQLSAAGLRGFYSLVDHLPGRPPARPPVGC